MKKKLWGLILFILPFIFIGSVKAANVNWTVGASFYDSSLAYAINGMQSDASVFTKIVFADKDLDLATCEAQLDLSTEGHEGTVVACQLVVNNKKELHIKYDGTLVLNDGQSFLYGFENVTEISGLNTLDTSNVESMQSMFYGLDSLTTPLDLSTFNTSNVTNMSSMFSYYPLANITFTGWDTSKVENIDFMFTYSSVSNATVASFLGIFDTTSLTSMDHMFELNKALTSVSFPITFDTQYVTDMNNLFYNCENITSLDLQYLDTGRVTDMSGMFGGMKKLTSLDISHFNTQNVTNMASMFSSCKQLQTITFGTGFNTSNVETINSMFSGCESLSSLNLSSWNTSKMKYMAGVFYGTKALTSLNLNGWNTSNVETMAGMFEGTGLTSIDLGGFNTVNVTDMSRMFAVASNLKSVNVSSFNTSKVTTMSYMFGLTGLTTLNLGNFNTSNVTNMAYMFTRLSNLTSLDLSNFNTQNLENMSGMFSYSKLLVNLNISSFRTPKLKQMEQAFAHLESIKTLDLSNFDTSHVVDENSIWNMVYQFSGDKALVSVNLSSFNTSGIKDMLGVFDGCESLVSLDLSSFDTSNVTRMSQMFYKTKALKSLNITSFNTSKVTEMTSMFDNSGLEVLNLSSFDTSKVTDMRYMFGYMENINTIYVSNKWTTAAETHSTDEYNYMFYRNPNLVGGGGTKYNSSNITKEYARIDGGTAAPGYFTDIKDYKATTSISLNKPSLSLNIGDSETLTVTFTPSNTTDSKSITWTSSNADIASVDSNGKVTAKKSGSVTIVATSSTGHIATCEVTVIKPIESIALDKTDVSLKVKETATFTVTFTPSDTTDNKSITWTSNNEKVATVKDGKVTAIKAGTATITATTKNGKTATATVKVSTPLKSISVDEKNINVGLKKKYTIKVNYNPSDTTDDKTLTYESKNTKIATVSKKGVITGKKIGKTKIVVTAKNGSKVTLTVNVLHSIEDATISGIKNTTYTGSKISQKITVKYNNNKLKYKTDYKITYKNNKKVGIATVIIDGIGSYTGQVVKTFNILPNSTTISKLTAKSKAMVVKWKKQATETTGYQIEYSLKSNFSGSTKVLVKKNKTTSLTIEKLKSKKKYYVRIRTYKLVDGKKIYSKWSNVLSTK